MHIVRCETKIYKNAICLSIKNLQIHNLANLLPVQEAGLPEMDFWIINKWHISQQLLCLFSKNLDTMFNVTDCAPSQTDLSWGYKFVRACTSFVWVSYEFVQVSYEFVHEKISMEK